MKKHLELKNKTYTMRANLNADCVKALKDWNKADGKAVAEAIRTGNMQKAAYHIHCARLRSQEIRLIYASHDKIICNASGTCIAVYDGNTGVCFDILN